ncbi:MAG: M15 family metallopeptidase [Polyangiaceae bacterium]|nr:M15 family metallopeptidase [Polyangiaceae bacterium]
MSAVARTFAIPLFFGALVLAHAAPAQGDDSKNDPAAHPGEDAGVPAPAPKEEAVVRASVQMAPPKNDSRALTITTADGRTATCREQTAQPFLVRGNWFPSSKDPEIIKHGRKLLEDAIKYRTSTYGYFEGFGSRKANPHPPKFYAKPTTFMGLTVQVHEKIIPALKCVEAALKANGAANEYKPRSAGGIRFKNTYRGVEVSNHVYGIAIDIEPDRNSCCGCVAPWPNHPLCKAKHKTVWERMAMPKSWVDTFERYGFYWLGHDVLQDTMHFEFLGDPDKILDIVKS